MRSLSRLSLSLAVLAHLGLAPACDSGSSASEESESSSASDSTESNGEESSGAESESGNATAESETGGDGDGDGDTGEPPGPAEAGSLTLITYNVAGLPEGLSSGDPVPHMPQISPLLNDFDIVVVQEDFWYHDVLSADTEHPHVSMPWSDAPSLEDMGDGLNRFSTSPFELHERQAWYSCNGQFDCGSDCLATKGWSFARHSIAEGFELDVYNLHHEAGGCDEDLEIRDQATDDLIAAVMERSGSRPLVIAGDYNLHANDPVDRAVMDRMAEQLGLEDACWALDCGTESIDRVFFRGSQNVSISVSAWSQPEQFVDVEDGGALSDHLPTAVTIEYAPTE